MTGGTVPPAFRFLTAVVDPIAQSRAFMIFICRYLSTAASVQDGITSMVICPCRATKDTKVRGEAKENVMSTGFMQT